MNKQKELAVKVMELANALTQWDFEMKQENNTYLVGTTLQNQKGQNMTICYQIGKENTQLTVFSSNCRYDDVLVSEKINAIPLALPVYGLAFGKTDLSINSPMSTDLLDSQMGTIVMRRMPDMIGAMTDIINHCK